MSSTGPSRRDGPGVLPLPGSLTRGPSQFHLLTSGLSTPCCGLSHPPPPRHTHTQACSWAFSSCLPCPHPCLSTPLPQGPKQGLPAWDPTLAPRCSHNKGPKPLPDIRSPFPSGAPSNPLLPVPSPLSQKEPWLPKSFLIFQDPWYRPLLLPKSGAPLHSSWAATSLGVQAQVLP